LGAFCQRSLTSWENIKSIQSQLIPILTEDKLLSILLEEEERRKYKKGGKGDGPSGAFGAQGGNPKGKGGHKGQWGKKGTQQRRSLGSMDSGVSWDQLPPTTAMGATRWATSSTSAPNALTTTPPQLTSRGRAGRGPGPKARARAKGLMPAWGVRG